MDEKDRTGGMGNREGPATGNAEMAYERKARLEKALERDMTPR